MAQLKHGDRVIHYDQIGSGPPVLLVHSGGYTASQWRGLMQALQGRYRLLAIDLQGCSGTTGWTEPPRMTLSDEGRLVRALAETCGAPVHLVGHSYGGAVALRAALDHAASYASLTLMEPIAFNLLREAGETQHHAELLTELEAFVGRSGAGEPGPAMGRFVNYWNAKPGMWEGLPEEVRAQLTARVPAMHHQCMGLKYDTTSFAELKALRTPTALITFEKTIAPMRRLVELLAARMNHPRHVIVPGLRHMAPATHGAPVAEVLAAALGDGVNATSAAG